MLIRKDSATIILKAAEKSDIGMTPGRTGMAGKKEIVELLQERGVDFEIYEHEPITSVEESKELGLPHKGAGTKNFFLRDKKKKNYFIITTKEDKRVDLRRLREILGTTALSFASEEDLDRMLGVVTGAVGPFGALNESEHRVRVYIDAEFRQGLMDAHPNDNAATMFLKADDVLELLREGGTPAEYIDLD